VSKASQRVALRTVTQAVLPSGVTITRTRVAPGGDLLLPRAPGRSRLLRVDDADESDTARPVNLRAWSLCSWSRTWSLPSGESSIPTGSCPVGTETDKALSGSPRLWPLVVEHPRHRVRALQGNRTELPSGENVSCTAPRPPRAQQLAEQLPAAARPRTRCTRTLPPFRGRRAGPAVLAERESPCPRRACSFVCTQRSASARAVLQHGHARR